MDKPLIRWEPPTYQPKNLIADVDGVGRWYIKKYGAKFELKLNGTTVGTFPTVDEAKALVQTYCNAR